MIEQELLDFGDDEDEPAVGKFDWEEVPQDVFMSWPEVQQLTYCAERDLHSAEHEDDLARKEWFVWRAIQYQRMIDERTR